MILLRCYGTIWDFSNSVFGASHISEPPNTFGVFVALGFVVGMFIGTIELQRREALGIFKTQTKKIMVGGIDWNNILTFTIFMFLVGMKLVGRYTEFDLYSSDPNHYILSGEGSLLGGFLLGGLAFLYLYYQDKKNALPTPVEKEVTVKPSDLMGDIVVLALFGGILGSKLWDLVGDVDSFRHFIQNPISSLSSGLSVLGGLFGAGALIFYYAKKKEITLSYFIDSLAPAFFLAYAVGRQGCQWAGDGCWGIQNDPANKPFFIPQWLWGQNYANNVNDIGDIIVGSTEKFNHVLPYTVFPTPMYETIVVTLLFLVLWALRSRMTFYPWMTFSVMLIFNGVERFLIEFIRINHKYEFFGIILSKHQYVALIMIAVGGICAWRIKARGSKESEFSRVISN
jgi:phosphatidylglycerol---prolipoprotein diacylglyceryl transferase